MSYSSEGDQKDFSNADQQGSSPGKIQFAANAPDREFKPSASDNTEEVDDKILHEDDDDSETGDKIDDSELDLQDPITGNDDEEVIKVTDADNVDSGD